MPVMTSTSTFMRFNKKEIEQSIPARFEEQVRTYPDRIAVKTKTQTLTYKALNKIANIIARNILVRRGNGDEQVALLLDHDALMISAILAVLKAGKVYVPLEPSYPSARLAHIVKDSQASLILTNKRYLHLASTLAQSQQQLLDLDEIDYSLDDDDLTLSLSPHASAYILYTSGSTGRPKGVFNSHRNVLHNIMRYTNSSHICTDDRLTLLQKCSNSGSVSSLFGALLNGATLLPFDLRDEGVSAVASWVLREKITIYHSVPIVFRRFLTAQQQFPNVRLIRLGGDKVSRKDVELFRKHFMPECVLVNGLGATECGLIRQYFIDRRTEISGSVVPIGGAVEDMEILLLDDQGRQLKVAEVGEIAVRSQYLARGYWCQPELTSAAFLPDPQRIGSRIYRTGDLGRMRSDGCLEHLGRKDSQIKVRGHRVEPAEVELALLALSAIKEAAVVGQEAQHGEQRLIAYVVPTEKRASLNASRLRLVLAETLPEHMIPSTYIFLDALPLNSNGKLDRQALPGPESARPEIESSFEPPRTAVETTLANIWAHVLGIDNVGTNDNFIELGGDSLLATQVISRVRETFQIEIAIRDFFVASTIAALATTVETLKDKTSAAPHLTNWDSVLTNWDSVSSSNDPLSL